MFKDEILAGSHCCKCILSLIACLSYSRTRLVSGKMSALVSSDGCRGGFRSGGHGGQRVVAVMYEVLVVVVMAVVVVSVFDKNGNVHIVIVIVIQRIIVGTYG